MGPGDSWARALTHSGKPCHSGSRAQQYTYDDQPPPGSGTYLSFGFADQVSTVLYDKSKLLKSGVQPHHLQPHRQCYNPGRYQYLPSFRPSSLILSYEHTSNLNPLSVRYSLHIPPQLSLFSPPLCLLPFSLPLYQCNCVWSIPHCLECAHPALSETTGRRRCLSI
jgi:hypothetical protein